MEQKLHWQNWLNLHLLWGGKCFMYNCTSKCTSSGYRKKQLAQFLREWIEWERCVCIDRFADHLLCKTTPRVNCLLRTLKFLFYMSAAKIFIYRWKHFFWISWLEFNLIFRGLGRGIFAHRFAVGKNGLCDHMNVLSFTMWISFHFYIGHGFA